MEVGAPIQPPESSWRRKLLKWIAGIFAAIILVIVLLVGLLFIYEDEVKAAVIKELNRHLKSEVRINPANIDLTIIKTFPDCSIEFRDVLMLEALSVKKKDTLLFAGNLNLYFNIKDLWNKRYKIEKVKLANAVAKPAVLKNGKNNYSFWQTGSGEKRAATDTLRFDLQMFEIERCRLSYRDRPNSFKADLMIDRLSFSGHFLEANYTMESDASVFIKQLSQGKSTYLKEKDLAFSVALEVNNDQYRFTKTKISLNKLALELEGGFRYADSLRTVNLSYKAPGLDIVSALSLLPEAFRQKINDYKSEGNFYATGNFNYTGAKNYDLQSNFGIKNGQITYKPLTTKVTNVEVTGFLKLSHVGSQLDLKTIHLKLGNDDISGNCNIQNFSSPHIKASIRAKVDLKNLQNFWPIDTLAALSGIMEVDASVDGHLEDLKSRTFSNTVKLDLAAAVSNLEVQFKDDKKVYAVENCSITAKDREIEVHDLLLKRGHSDIKVNGKMPGIFNYLSDRKAPLVITGNLFSNYIALEDFLPEKAGNSGGTDAPLIPESVEFKLNAAILKFSYAKFEAHNITGEIEIKDQKAMVSDVKLDAMEGDAEIDAYADNSRGRLDVVLQSKIRNINISELFSEFNNFGQGTLTNRHLKGYATAEIDFSGTWNNRLEADLGKLKATVDLTIDKGELIDFKPLLSLSDYVDIKDLQHIKFSSLSSQVEIKGRKIVLPRTSIKNSALNIEFWGTHDFDNTIDYHIQLLISEYLAKKRKKDNDEFGPVERDADNRRSAFFLMTGNINNPVIKYDRKGLKEKIKGDLKHEKQSIKQILKEEFGLFKHDTLKKHVRKEEQVFELEKSDKTRKQTGAKKKEEDDEDF